MLDNEAIKYIFRIFEQEEALNSDGIYITTVFSLGLALEGFWTSTFGDKKLVPLPPKAPSKSDQAFIVDHCIAGKVEPFNDQDDPLSVLLKALCHLNDGHAQGKVVIAM